MATMTWGRWTFNPSTACLETPLGGGGPYQIPVDEMSSSAAILDWIFQIHEKTWASADDKDDLTAAILELVGRGVCSGGFERVSDIKKRLNAAYGCVF